MRLCGIILNKYIWITKTIGHTNNHMQQNMSHSEKKKKLKDVIIGGLEPPTSGS